MNRIPLLRKRCGGRSRAVPVSSMRAHILATAKQFYFAPLHYERNYSYPLIVWLHGPDNNENQLKQIMPLVSMRNYVGAAPRAPAVSEIDHGENCRFTWRLDEANVTLAEERLWECLDGARKRFNIAPNRIFLAGLECGGTMAIRLALRNPHCFTAALSFGGPFPTAGAPLARLHLARRVALFFATTSQSMLYPQSAICEDLRLFHTAGLSVHIRQYPGEDGLTNLMLSDMDRWIMEHVTDAHSGPARDLIEHRSTS
jgi:phospholipase/carboxylesterase